jgi:hypothetical protein
MDQKGEDIDGFFVDKCDVKSLKEEVKWMT